MTTRHFPTTQPQPSLKSLAESTQTALEEVQWMYEHELAHLEAGARVRTFVSAIALKKVRARLRAGRDSAFRHGRTSANATRHRQ